MKRLPVIDTHTGGEPTRVIFAEEAFAPQTLKVADSSESNHGLLQALAVLRDPVAIRDHLRDQADFIRRSLVTEPRGSDFMVGAWVSPPVDTDHIASVVFFNNVGYLGMCGHGLIGVVEALRHSGRITVGRHRVETPVGNVAFTLHQDHSVTFENVPSYRYRSNVPVSLHDDLATVTGDIAYGGNWFFLVDVAKIEMNDQSELLRHCLEIREALRRQGITGKDGAEIDHVELEVSFSSPVEPRGGRNFVLCPGGHYDRSPCGTGTSAKVACLAAEGKLEPSETWVQESVIGSRFDASYRHYDPGHSEPGHSEPGNQFIVSIRGRAFVTAETNCVLDPDDPFRFGVAANESNEKHRDETPADPPPQPDPILEPIN
jgi:proline racemase